MITGDQGHIFNKVSSWALRKNILWYFVALISFKFALDLSYYFIISELWRYNRFELNLNSIKLIESYILIFIVWLLICKDSKKLSYILLWLLIMLAYIPMLTIYAFMDQARIFIYTVTMFWISVSLLMKLPTISIPHLKQSRSLFFYVVFCLIAYVAVTAYWYLGFSFNIDLSSVYSIRTRYVEKQIPFSGYLWNWTAYVVDPILLAFFLSGRRWLFITLICLFQIWLFSITGIKAYLFSLLLVSLLIWTMKKKNPLIYVCYGLTCAILLGALSYWLFDDVWITSLATRRFLLVPAQISFFYYEYFSNNEAVLLSHSIFRLFLVYPYYIDVPHLIGQVFFDNPQMASNNGIVGDAYMNFGFAGLFFWAFLLFIILKLIDSCSKGLNLRISIAAIAMSAITLTNSGLLTNLLTHGLALAIILLYLLPRDEAYAHNNFDTAS